ncbi:MAG TPA: hypothetical protein VNK95_02935 [Caldilineaceae bacterium]|nr:hypothetical protein [Caldilineaceae bacterium]
MTCLHAAGCTAGQPLGFVQNALHSIIEVNSAAADATAGDEFCTLREASLNANADSDSTAGDCTGGAGEDAITYAPSLGASPLITLSGQLPNITSALIVSGVATLDANQVARHFWIMVCFMSWAICPGLFIGWTQQQWPLFGKRPRRNIPG